MRAITCIAVTLGLAALCSAFASEGVEELLGVFRAHDDALVAHVRASAEPYFFTENDIRILTEAGVSRRVISEAIDHGNRVRASYQPVVVEPVVQTAVVYAPAPEQTNISFFYDALSPHGNWIDVEGTWMWHPAVANADPNWRPYCDSGNWVYTDSGWAWHSEYAWGWAPFHYGRWSHNARHGWIWAPDTVWSPAWVSWRTSDSHYGWAPLPPAARYEEGIGIHIGGKHVDLDLHFGLTERDYCFIPAQRMCEPRLNTYVVPAAQVNLVYNRTTIVQNNITYNDNRIINRGPAIEHVRAVTQRNIQVVRIADANVQPGHAIQGNSLSGNTFAVYRPQVKNAAPIAPPALIARREAAQLNRDTTQNIKAQRIENVAERSADRRETNFAAKQQVLDARTEAHDANKQESAAETAARIKAREQELSANRAAAEREAAARQQTREVRRESVDAKRVESTTETQARLRAAEVETAARQKALETPRPAAETKRTESIAELQAKLKASQAETAAREKAFEARRTGVETRRVETSAEAQSKIQTQDAAEQRRKAQASSESAAREQTKETRAQERQHEAELRKDKTSKSPSDKPAIPGE